MYKNITAMLIDIGVLVALFAISLGIWFFPSATLLLTASVMVGGCMFVQDSGW